MNTARINPADTLHAMMPRPDADTRDAVAELIQAEIAYRNARARAWGEAHSANAARYDDLCAAMDDAHSEMLDAAAQCAFIGESAAAYCDAMAVYGAMMADDMYADAYRRAAAIIRDDMVIAFAADLAAGICDDAMMYPDDAEESARATRYDGIANALYLGVLPQ